MALTVTPKLSSIVSPFIGLKLQFGQDLVGAGHLCLAQLGLKGGVTTVGSPEVSPFFVVSPAGSGRVSGPRTQRPRVSKVHGGWVVSRQRTDCRLTRAPESPRASSASAVHPGSSGTCWRSRRKGTEGQLSSLPVEMAGSRRAWAPAVLLSCDHFEDKVCHPKF